MEFISSFTITVIGVLNPLYSTYRSLRKKTEQNRLIWLRYWVAFGLFYSITFIADLIFYWLPFYYLAKIIFVFWLSSSTASGAQIMYKYVLLPLLKDYENELDKLINFWRRSISTSFWKSVSRLSFKGSTIVFDILKFLLIAPTEIRASGDVTDEIMDTDDVETSPPSSNSQECTLAEAH